MSILQRIWRWLGPFALLMFFVSMLYVSQTRYDDSEDSAAAQIVSSLQFIDNHFFDWRSTRLIPPPEKYTDPDIVLVVIDDESLSKIGKYPFPRRVYAQVLDRLAELDVKTVGFDVLYPENSNPEDDRLFLEGVQRFKDSGRDPIFTYSLSNNPGDSTPDFPPFVFEQVINGSLPKYRTTFYINQFTDPFQELQDLGVTLGYISNREDRDGVFRHYILVANIDLPKDVDDGAPGFAMPSFAASMYQSYTGNKIETTSDAANNTVAKIDNISEPLDQSGALRIRYTAKLSNYQGIPMWMLLNKITKKQEEKIKKAFKGKVAVIGSIAEGAHDFRSSPIDPKMPGMLGHTNMLHMLIRGHFYKDDSINFLISLAMLIVGFILMKLTMRAGNALLDLFVLIAISAAIIAIDTYFLLPEGYQLRLFFPLACTFFTYSWTTFINFQKTIREKRQIKGTFARYVSPAIVNEMLDHPDKLKVGGEKRDITCLFSDVRDFTSISEKLTATELSGALNQYMGRMTDIVFETKGTLDKYIGDAIVAFWGAPLDLPNHPDHAVEAAVKMMEALPAVNADFKARGLPEFKVGIGLNSGECAVGNMGSDKIFSYTALGDNMNLGARLEGLCKYYGAQILISEYTKARLPDGKYKTRPLDKVKVKGKTTPVQIIEVIHGVHPMAQDPQAFDFYNLAYEKFLAKDFAQAKTILEGVLLAHPEDKPTGRLIKMCEKWLNEIAPDDFDVTTMTEK